MTKKQSVSGPGIIKIKRNGKEYPFFAPWGVPGKFVVGMISEISPKNNKEISIQLPIEAIKRLIRSYYDDIRSYDEECVYLEQVDTTEMRRKDYADIMLASIEEQLGEAGLNAKEIQDEIFKMYFEDAYEKMRKCEDERRNKLTKSDE